MFYPQNTSSSFLRLRHGDGLHCRIQSDARKPTGDVSDDQCHPGFDTRIGTYFILNSLVSILFLINSFIHSILVFLLCFLFSFFLLFSVDLRARYRDERDDVPRRLRHYEAVAYNNTGVPGFGDVCIFRFQHQVIHLFIYLFSLINYLYYFHYLLDMPTMPPSSATQSTICFSTSPTHRFHPTTSPTLFSTH